jgi:hypothetical protein
MSARVLPPSFAAVDPQPHSSPLTFIQTLKSENVSLFH